MVGMDEALVADWFVVSMVEGMKRLNRIRLEEQRGLSVAGYRKERIARRTAKRVKLMPAIGG